MGGKWRFDPGNCTDFELVFGRFWPGMRSYTEKNGKKPTSWQKKRYFPRILIDNSARGF
jgi:hypothetical protein